MKTGGYNPLGGLDKSLAPGVVVNNVVVVSTDVVVGSTVVVFSAVVVGFTVVSSVVVVCAVVVVMPKIAENSVMFGYTSETL